MSDVPELPDSIWASPKIGYDPEADHLDGIWTASHFHPCQSLFVRTDHDLAVRQALSKHQESEFHPDWSMLEATRSSLKEHQQMIRDLRQALSEAERDAARYRWLHERGCFRANLDMSGNHGWMTLGKSIGRGVSADAAIDAAMKDA